MKKYLIALTLVCFFLASFIGADIPYPGITDFPCLNSVLQKSLSKDLARNDDLFDYMAALSNSQRNEAIVAWVSLLSDNEIRVNVDDLRFVVYYFNKRPNNVSNFKTNFANSGNKRFFLDETINAEAYGFRFEVANLFTGEPLSSTKICFGLSEVNNNDVALQKFALYRMLEQDIYVLDIWAFRDANHISGSLTGQGFVDNFHYLTANVESIHFNLKGITNYEGSPSVNMLNRIALDDVPDIPVQHEHYTMWELNKVLKTELFNKTFFYHHEGFILSGADARSYFEDIGITVYQ